KLDVAGCSCPANHWWKRAGGATDNDVLRRQPLQPHRVYDDVKEYRESEQRRGLDIERETKNGDPAASKDEPEDKRFQWRDRSARDRSHGSASHDTIDVGVVPHIEDAGGGSSPRYC